jgi:hypothetical protein
MQNRITLRHFVGAQFNAPMAARRTPRRGKERAMNRAPTCRRESPSKPRRDN